MKRHSLRGLSLRGLTWAIALPLCLLFCAAVAGCIASMVQA